MLKSFFKKLHWLLPQCRFVIVPIISIILISSLYSICSVYRAYITKSLIDSAITGIWPIIIKWITILGLLLLIDIISKSIISVIATKTAGKLSNKIQKRLYKHIIYSDWYEHSKKHSVDLMTRITSDVDTISSLIVNTIPNIFSLVVMLSTAFIALLIFEPTMAIVAVVIFPTSILLSKLFGRRIKKYYLEVQKSETRYRTFMHESIQNITIVKSFRNETSNLSNLDSLQDNKLKLLIKRNNVGVFSNIFLQIGSWIGYFCVFTWGALNLANGPSTFGTLTALLQLFGNIQAPFSGLAHCFPQLVHSYAAIERLMEIEKIPLEEFKEIKIKPNLTDKSPVISFKDVSFGYESHKKILDNISFDINPGEIVGIVGPSGEGKTTLVRLLLSLLHPNEGEIILKNESTSEELNPNHRDIMSYVPQGNTLFSGTIQSNIEYGFRPSTFTEIRSATQSAGAYEFITKSEDKFKTIVGEGGTGISEGQAQRISLARAFIRQKPVLILDEATSALDIQTELKVLTSIKTLENNPTCIIITHRPSALDICDKVITIQDGKVEVIA